MKNKFTKLLNISTILYCITFSFSSFAQNIGINSTGATPDVSAMLDIVSSDKGMLLPRVALVQTTSNTPIGASIANSLLVYNTATVNDVTPGFYYWNGTTWSRLLNTGGLDGNGIYSGDGISPSDVDVTVTDNIDFDASTLFIDGTGNRVGVGTVTPNSKLEVAGTIRSTQSNAANDLSFADAGLLLLGNQNESSYLILGQPNIINWRIANRATSGRLDFTTGSTGNEKMSISTSGNVGIGTTTPLHKTQITSSNSNTGIGSNDFLGITNTDVTTNNYTGMAFKQFDNASNDQTVATIGIFGTSHTTGSQSADIVLGTRNVGSYGEKMRITSDGNVGIGTTTPTEKLDVNGQFKALSGFSTFTSDGLFNVNAEPSYIELPNNGSIRFGYFSSGSGVYQGRVGSMDQLGANSSWGATGAGNNFSIQTGGTEALRIDNNQNVGIGTTTPRVLTDIAPLLSNNTTNTLLAVSSSNIPTHTTKYQIALGPYSAGSSGYYSLIGFDKKLNNVSNHTGDLYFSTSPSNGTIYSAPVERMRIQSNGNIGIGTTTPTEKLHVNGSIRMTDGNEGVGKVMVSNATGTASWTTASSINNGGGIYGGDGTTPADVDVTVTDNIDFDASTLFIDGTNNRVGVGTATPTHGLHVNVNTTGHALLRLTSKNNNDTHIRYDYPSDNNKYWVLGTEGTPSFLDDFALWNSDRSQFDILIDNLSGNIGIGTTSPSEKLDVVGDIKIRSTNRLHFSNTSDRSYIYAPSSDQLAFGSGGTERVRINTTGNVGIGTTTPSELLELNGGGIQLNNDFGIGFRSETPADGNVIGDGFKMYYDENLFGANQDGIVFEKTDINGVIPDGGIAFVNKGSNNVESISMAIRGSGNVGIGTTAPTSKLYVSDAGAGNTVVGTFFRSGASTGNETSIQIGANSLNNSDNYLEIGHEINTSGGTDRAYIGLRDNYRGYINLRSNNVGIGTISPSAKLEVENTIAAGTDNYSLKLQNTTTATNSNVGIEFSVNSVSSAGAKIKVNNDGSTGGDMSFITETANTDNTRMFIDASTGGIGIGTVTPEEDFHIYSGGNAGLKSYTNHSGNEGLVVSTYWNSSGSNLGVVDFISARHSNTTSGGSSFRFFTQPRLSSGAGNAVERMTIDMNGNIGIGTSSPGGQLELSLDQGRKPSTNTWTITSDERLKNINGKYNKGLEEILKLNTITYNYKNVGEKTFKEEVLNTEAIGFSAQEVQKIFPEAVGVDKDGYLNFNIHSILVAHINATQEQQNIIEQQQQQIEKQNDLMEKLMKRIDALESK